LIVIIADRRVFAMEPSSSFKEVTIRMLQFCRDFQACSDPGAMADLKNESGKIIAAMIAEFEWLRDSMRSSGPEGPAVFEDESDTPQSISDFGHLIYHNFKPLIYLRNYLARGTQGHPIVHFDGFPSAKWYWNTGIRENRISPPSRFMHEQRQPDFRGLPTLLEGVTFIDSLVSHFFKIVI
jgi:hypothetical protein